MFCFIRAVKTALFAFALIVAFAALESFAGTVEINLAATADIHGRSAQIKYAVTPLIKAARRSDPDLIYIDIGDTVQGTLKLLQNRGSGITDLLHRAGCTLWVPGNHELEFGLTAFKKIVRSFPGTVLAANIKVPGLEDKVRDFLLLEIKGVKIAIIGMTLPGLEKSFPMAESAYQTLPGAAALRKAVNRARSKGAQIFVLARHCGMYGGRENLTQLLDKVPEIDLVIGAHDHRKEPGCRIRNAWYVQSGAYGEYLAMCRLVWDKRSGRIVQINSHLKALDIYPEAYDPAADKVLDKYFNKPPDAIAERIREYAQSDLAIYCAADKFNLRHCLRNKYATVGDYFKVFDHYDGIVTVEVSAAEASIIVREYDRYARTRKQLLLLSGWRLKKKSVEFARKQTVYKLALTAYAAAGAGGFLPETARILKNRIDFVQAEGSPALLEILMK